MTGAAAWAIGCLALMIAPAALAQTVTADPPFGLSVDLPPRDALGAPLDWTQQSRVTDGDLTLRFQAQGPVIINLTAFRADEETDPALYAEDARQSLISQGAKIIDSSQSADTFQLTARGVDAATLRVYGRLVKDCEGFDLMAVIQMHSSSTPFADEWQSITRSLTPCEADQS